MSKVAHLYRSIGLTRINTENELRNKSAADALKIYT